MAELIFEKKTTALALFLVVVAVALAGMLFSGNVVSGAESCMDVLKKLRPNCGPYIQRGGPSKPPSKKCCDTVASVDVSCFCSKDVLPPPGLDPFVSLTKLVRVIQICGKKCGQPQ